MLMDKLAEPRTRQLPIVVCDGAPYARGHAHGSQMRGVIAVGVERWSASLRRRHDVAPDRYIDAFLAGTDFLPAIDRHTPGLLDEVRGIAVGAGQPFATILAYNLMDEEWTFGERFAADRTARNGSPGCTVAYLRPAADDAVLAQTMDIPSVHDGTQIVLDLRPEDQPRALVFTAAGMIALTGVNGHGVGVGVNNLSVLPGSTTGLPVMFAIRGILAQATHHGAAGFVGAVPHATGQNYAIGSPTGFVSLEADAARVSADPNAAGDRFVHTNHPLVNRPADPDPAADYAASNTRRRFDRAVELLALAVDQPGVERLLQDEAAPISCAPRAGAMTFGAVSIRLSTSPTVRVTPGPPHLHDFVEVGFQGV